MTPCSKLTYSTRESAVRSMRHIRAKARPGRRVPIRTYECRACGGWHLTSMPLATPHRKAAA